MKAAAIDPRAGETTVELPASYPKTGAPPGPFDAAGSSPLGTDAAPYPTTATGDAGPMLPGVSLTPPNTNVAKSVAPVAGQTPGVSSTNVLPAAPSGAFQIPWNEINALIVAKPNEALDRLSRSFDDPSLSAEENRRVMESLDQLAGTVIYSRDHLLAPAHVVQGTPFIDEVPLPHFFGSGIVVSLPKKKWEQITADDLEKACGKAIRKGDVLIINTGWHKVYEDGDYFPYCPGFVPSAADWMIEKGVKVVGHDTQANDHPLATAIGPQRNGPLLPHLAEEYKQWSGGIDWKDAFPEWEPVHQKIFKAGILGIENVGDADLVIEAVFETMAVKKEVFGKLDQFAKPGAVLASNTSYLNIDEIAKSTKRPQDVLGMHFFSPANVMKLCEIVRAAKTAPDALTTAVSIARKIAKVPAVVGVCDGFVGNRMLAQRGKQSEKLLFEGALPQQVDAVVTKFGMPMGPFAMGDLAGLDIGWRSRKDRGLKSEIADALCEAGRFGQKTGKGYYKYEGGSRAALPDPEVEKLIDETLLRLGRKKRVVSDDEILERMMYPMINEGAKILEEGIAARPSDIDVVWLYGYGWPIYRGGPMFWADTVGLKHIADRLAFYAKETNDPSLEPAPLLKKLAAEGKTFASLAAASKAA